MFSRLTLLLAVSALPALALCACDAGEDQDGVGGLAASDARALNEAAARLDRQTAQSAAPDVPANPAAAMAARSARTPAPEPTPENASQP